jgi:signal transduction histidine kinase
MLESHLLHQQLFFIPIILAGFWFRLQTGLFVAAVVSAIYISSMVFHMHSPSVQVMVFTQISLYIFVAALIGWLTGRLEKQQQQTIQDEKWRSVTKLASVLGFEIHEIVRGLEERYQKSGGLLDTDPDLKEEINKLKQLTKAFEQFDSPEAYDLMTQDLNEIVRKTQRKFQPKAKVSRVNITTELDRAGCPSMVINDAIIQLFEALVDNAIEASPRGSKIILRSTRKGSHCLLEVIDNGHGVSEDKVPLLFTPFFTTKPHGHGLSLAAGKKIMKDHEGDLIYEPGKNGGAIFKIFVPRENITKNIHGHISEKVQH